MNKKQNKPQPKRWTREDDSYIRENFGRKTVEVMARELERTVMSVRLYIHRQRLVPMGQRTVKRNLLVELLRIRFRHLEDFHPSKWFYAECHMSAARYADLFYGRRQIKPEEYRAIASYFDITAAEAMDSRQLELFDEFENTPPIDTDDTYNKNDLKKNEEI
ncbi:MAG: XRE family transcriptional regulator [Prevotella sp.]|nr:XRE family transcriptional regulator [Prevotella sp.]